VDQFVDSMERLNAVLARISFRPSCVNMGWEWEIERVYSAHDTLRGWFISTTFRRPDTDTGEVGRGRGRREFIEYGATVSSVVKTAWLCAELIVRHELMEAFCFDGKRVFDPHKTVDELTYGERNKEVK
jgi:hypothetical protein